MNIDKNTILAIFLLIGVLIIWQLLFQPKPDQIQKQQETAVEEIPQQPSVLPEHEKSITPLPAESQIPSPTKEISKVNEKEIFVETPLYRAVLSNVGPTIKSFQLKKYRQTTNPDSPLVELVNLDEDSGDFLLMGFDDPSRKIYNKYVYQTDVEALHLDSESVPREIIFNTVTPEGTSIKQTFRIYADRYAIDHGIDVVNKSGDPIRGALYAKLRVIPPSKKRGMYSYAGLILLVEDELEKIKIKKTSQEKKLEGQIQWMAYEDNYFISAVVPKTPSTYAFTGNLLPSGQLEGSYTASSVSIAPAAQISSNNILYFGPRDLTILKQVGLGLDRAVDFGWANIISKPLLSLLRFFNGFIHNYGVSIILLTILIKIIFWPLTHKSFKSMKEMQKLQPLMAKIRERYKNDKQQMNKEIMALYKTYKVNPMSGCLPLVIQFPVLYALFRLLGSAIELRHEPFMLWINDLSAPDRLFNFPFKIPFMSPPYGIPVLALLMGASWILQQKMTPTPGDPAQAKMMMLMPVIFTVISINFPSGLVLYWFVTNILSIGQQYRIHKRAA
jgi:YidC/Oxa1 family membrane protein insertase